jgi:hypothetical protein
MSSLLTPSILTSNELSSILSISRDVSRQGSTERRDTDMGQMDAVTELELAGVRRREVVLQARGDVVRARRQVEHAGRMNLTQLATAVAAAVLRTPLARG